MESIKQSTNYMNGLVDFDNQEFTVVINDDDSKICKLFYNEDNGQSYYTIMYNDAVIGGFQIKSNGLITGNINLSDFTGGQHKTCIITQMARDPKPILFMPKDRKAKYQPKPSQFVMRGNYGTSTGK